MFGINNKPYIKLDHHVTSQLAELESLKKEIAIGIAKVLAKKTGIDEYENFRDYVYPNKFENMESYQRISNFKLDTDIENQISFLNNREKQIFYKMFYGLYPTINYICIKDVPEWVAMMDHDDSIHFEFVKKWVKTLPFEEIKVIRLIVNEPGVKTLMHTDYDHLHIKKMKETGESPKIKESMYINLFEHKKFYIWDQDTDTKHIINAKASLWNFADWHGADSSEFPAWSLMVHGKYTDEFRKEVLK
jgi:hypothetical protein